MTIPKIIPLVVVAVVAVGFSPAHLPESRSDLPSSAPVQVQALASRGADVPFTIEATFIGPAGGIV